MIQPFGHSQCKFNNYRKQLGKRRSRLLHESLQRNLTLRNHFPLCAELATVSPAREPCEGCKPVACGTGTQADAFSHPTFYSAQEDAKNAKSSGLSWRAPLSSSPKQPSMGRCSPPCSAHSQRRPGQQPGSWLCFSLRGALDLDSISSAPQPAHLCHGNCAVPVSSPSHVLPGQPQYPDL